MPNSFFDLSRVFFLRLFRCFLSESVKFGRTRFRVRSCCFAILYQRSKIIWYFRSLLILHIQIRDSFYGYRRKAFGISYGNLNQAGDIFYSFSKANLSCKKKNAERVLQTPWYFKSSSFDNVFKISYIDLFIITDSLITF